MNGSIPVIYTREKENIGLYAIAEMDPKSINLVHYVQDCKTLNVCDSMKEAKEIEKEWNIRFLKNGKQKHYLEW